MDSYDELKITMGSLAVPLREIARRMGVSHGTLMRAEVHDFTPGDAAGFEKAVHEIGEELLKFSMPAHRIQKQNVIELRTEARQT